MCRTEYYSALLEDGRPMMSILGTLVVGRRPVCSGRDESDVQRETEVKDIGPMSPGEL